MYIRELLHQLKPNKTLCCLHYCAQFVVVPFTASVQHPSAPLGASFCTISS